MLRSFNFPGSSQVAPQTEESKSTSESIHCGQPRSVPSALNYSVKEKQNENQTVNSDATTNCTTDEALSLKYKSQVESELQQRLDKMFSNNNQTVDQIDPNDGELVEISEKPAEMDKLKYKQEDFVSYDAYFDYVETGDLSGLKTQKNKMMVDVINELKHEENYLVNHNATIQQLMEANRKMWKEREENIKKDELREFSKGFLKEKEKEHKEEQGYNMLKNLGVSEISLLRYEAEEKFPLTSYIGEYDTYTDQEVDALKDEERFEAHWERSPLGLAYQVLTNSDDMLSRIQNPHDEMYIP